MATDWKECLRSRAYAICDGEGHTGGKRTSIGFEQRPNCRTAQTAQPILATMPRPELPGQAKFCPACQGTGQKDGGVCANCRGTGMVIEGIGGA